MNRLLGLLISGALIVGSAGPAALAQQPDKGETGVKGAAKDVGKGTKKAAETTGKTVEKGTKKGVDATKKGADATKKGVEDAAKGTKKGAEKVGDKVNPKNW